MWSVTVKVNIFHEITNILDWLNSGISSLFCNLKDDLNSTFTYYETTVKYMQMKRNLSRRNWLKNMTAGMGLVTEKSER
jgi:hypothetical protein